MEFSFLGFTLTALLGSFVGLLIGGFSKGALGAGLPLISVPILALFMPVPQALVILIVPIFITNIWQAMQGGNLKVVWKRFWPIAIMLVIGVGVGAQILVRLSEQQLYLIMGLIVMAQPVLRLLKPNASFTPQTQRWLGPLVGFTGGAVGGMSGFYGPLILVYLATLKLQKDIFTATVAMLFLFGGGALAVFLAQVGVMTANDMLMSCIALIPASLGILWGQKIRARISQTTFDRALSITLLVMGVSLLMKAYSTGA